MPLLLQLLAPARGVEVVEEASRWCDDEDDVMGGGGGEPGVAGLEAGCLSQEALIARGTSGFGNRKLRAERERWVGGCWGGVAISIRLGQAGPLLAVIRTGAVIRFLVLHLNFLNF